MNLVEFHDVSFSYSNKNKLISGLSFVIPENKWTVVYGETGTGKTTIVKLILDFLAPQKGRIVRSFDDNNFPGYVMQNPDDQISQISVERELAFSLENRGFPREQIREKVEYFLEKFDFVEKRKSPPHYLSGGEKQRLALASLLIYEPKFLILDEPVSFLDVESQVMFINTLFSFEDLTVLWLTQERGEILLGNQILKLE